MWGCPASESDTFPDAEEVVAYLSTGEIPEALPVQVQEVTVSHLELA